MDLGEVPRSPQFLPFYHQVILCPGLQEPLDPMQSNSLSFTCKGKGAGSGHGLGQLQGVKDKKESKQSKRKENAYSEGQKGSLQVEQDCFAKTSPPKLKVLHTR